MKRIVFALMFVILIQKLSGVYQKVNDLFFDDTDYPEIEIIDNIAYIGDNSSGLRVYDISEAGQPELLETIPLQNPVRKIFINGDVTYIIGEYYLVFAIDSSDIANPELIYTFHIENRGMNICANEEYLYAYTYSDGGSWQSYLEIFSTANPYHPEYVTTALLDHNCTSMLAEDGILYTTSYGGFFVYDVSDPYGVYIMDWLDTSNSFSLKYYDDLLCFDGGGNYGLTFVDYSDPTNCEVYVRFRDIQFQDSEISGTKLYGADGAHLRVVDISDPLHSVQEDEYITFNPCSEVAVKDSIAYINNWYDNIGLINVSEGGNPLSLNYIDTRADMISKTANGEYMLLYGDYGSGLQFYNMESPLGPNLEYSHFSSGTYWGCSALYTDSEICCASFGNIEEGAALFFFDLDNLEIWPILSSLHVDYNEEEFWVESICRNGDFLYLACPGEGIIIIDIHDIENPQQVGTYDIAGFVFDISAKSNWLYYVNINGLHTLNITNPLQPEVGGSWISDHRAEQIEIYRDFIYLEDYDGGVKVIDIGDPTNPEVINTILFNSTSLLDQEMIVREDKLIVSDKLWNQIWVLDLSEPANPVIESSYKWNKYSLDMELFGDYLYCACGGNQMEHYGVTCLDFSSFNPVSNDNHLYTGSNLSDNLTNYPNPFYAGSSRDGNIKIACSIPEAQQVDLAVYNIKGQKVAQLVNKQLEAGTHQINWNMMTSTGKTAASGIYFSRLSTKGKETCSKLVIIR